MARLLLHLCAMLAAALVGLVLLTASSAAAQPTLKDLVEPLLPSGAQPTEAAASSTERPPASAGALDRGSPRATVRGFLDTTGAGNYDRAVLFMDASQLPAAERREAARRLRAVIDRQLWVDLGSVSDDPAGARDDALPADAEGLGWLETPDGPAQVQLQRVRRDGATLWLFSAETVATAYALYDRLGYGALNAWLPAPLLEISFLDVRLWQWAALIILAGGAYVVAWLAVRLAARILRPLARRRRTHNGEDIVRLGAGPARLLIAVAVFSAGMLPLGLSTVVRTVLDALLQLLTIVAVTWLVLRLLDLVGEGVRRRLRRDEKLTAMMLVTPGRRTAKVLIVTLAMIATLDNFGFNVTALLAGLGVGGIAVALAAQKSVENLFGGITLYADQPVRVGDFCRFGDRVGTVEDIGLRSTRIRTLERTVVSIPNAEFAGMQIENFSQRDKFWYHPTIGLRFDSSPDQVRYVIIEIQRLLHTHPMIEQSGPQVRFMRFGSSSLDLEVFAYVTASDFDRFKEVTEELNLRIMDIVAAAGTDFAFPSQTSLLEFGHGLDTDRQRGAEEQMRSWRQERSPDLRFLGETGRPGAGNGRSR